MQKADTSCARFLCDIFFLMILFFLQRFRSLAVLHTVCEVNCQTCDSPKDECDPGHSIQLDHQEHAQRHGNQWNCRYRRNFERPWHLRMHLAKYDHRNRYEEERPQRADIAQLCDGSDRKQSSQDHTDDPDTDNSLVGNAPLADL